MSHVNIGARALRVDGLDVITAARVLQNITASAALLTSGNLAYARLPTGTGAWDTGVGTTITISRALAVGGALSVAGISVADATGKLAIAAFNGGTGATATTFWRGDGTWATAGVDVAAAYNWTGAHTFASTVGITGDLTLPPTARLMFSGSGTAGTAAGDIALANTRTLRFRNSVDTGYIAAFTVSATDVIQIGPNAAAAGSPIAIGAPGSTSSSAGAEIVMENTKGLRSSNAAGTATVGLIRLDASNRNTIGLGSQAWVLENPSTAVSAGAVAEYLNVVVGGVARKIALLNT